MNKSLAAAFAALAIGLFASCSDDSVSPTAVSPDTGRHTGIFTPVSTSTTVQLLENLAAKQVLPYTNWWNLDISKAPVDTKSASYIS